MAQTFLSTVTPIHSILYSAKTTHYHFDSIVLDDLAYGAESLVEFLWPEDARWTSIFRITIFNVLYLIFLTKLAFAFASFWPEIVPGDIAKRLNQHVEQKELILNNIFNWVSNSFIGALAFSSLYYDDVNNLDAGFYVPQTTTGTILVCLAEVIVDILMYDLFIYWFHRSCHKVYKLWKFHALHHKSRVPNHYLLSIFGGELESALIAVVAMSIIEFFPQSIISSVIFCHFITFAVALNHSNRAIYIPLVYNGFYHHFHHIEYNVNFGEHTPVWDWLFGTMKPHSFFSGWNNYYKPGDSIKGISKLKEKLQPSVVDAAN